jgi:23S rRNA (adenine2503-C2)-methyltransferase
VNLIPMNPIAGVQLEAPPEGQVDAFADRLRSRGLSVFVRKQRGDDIDAACGQLVGQVEDRSRRGPRMIRLHAELPARAGMRT